MLELNNVRFHYTSLLDLTEVHFTEVHLTEVHHNLIQSVLGYHHIPHHISNIINSLYTDFQTSIITSKFYTPFIHVGRGVLQGDCLSPLLFNTTY